MPKRITRWRRWWIKTMEKMNPPAMRAFNRAMYDPHFTRQLWTWARAMRCIERDPDPQWADDCGYCLDRTEVIHT